MFESILDTVYRTFVLIALFGVTIFVHELGHFLVAVSTGMVVDVFSIGFGPAIWKKKVGRTTYKISWIPLGGYVALPQLDPAGMSHIQGSGPKTGDTVHAGYPRVAVWKRVLVSLAGGVGNVLMGILLAWIIFANPTADTAFDEPFIGAVHTNSAAYARGVRAGDRIDAVNGREVDSWYRYREECILSGGNTNDVMLTLSHAGTNREVMVPIEGSDMYAGIPGLRKAVPCLVGETVPDGNTRRAGLRHGDIVVSCDGLPVVSCDHLDRISERRSGKTATIGVERDGTNMQFEATLPLDGIEPMEQCVFAIVETNSPAESAGLKMWDRVVEFGGERVTGWYHFSRLVERAGNREMPITVERQGRLVTTAVTPRHYPEQDKIRIGVVYGPRPPAPWMQFKNPWAQIKSDAMAIVRLLRALVTPRESGQAAKSISGPPMILFILWIHLKVSMLNAVGFIRFLNINLAILNLLPIPVLDGGHIVFALWEGITRRRANPTVVNILVNIFLVLLLAAILFITARDIPRILQVFRPQSKAGQSSPAEQKPVPETGK